MTTHMTTQQTQPGSVSTSNPAEGGGDPLRVAFVTLYDAQDVTKMSGTGYNISQSFLRQGAHLEFIGPLHRQIRPMNALRHGFNRFLLRKNDHPQRDPAFLKHFSRQVEASLRGLDVDVVFGSGGLPVSYIQTDLPLVIWTDCTFANLLDYYGKYSNLSRRTIRDGHDADRNLYQRVERAIFASTWAADSAINDYGLAPEKATIVSRGANVPPGRSERDIEALIDARPTDRCILHLVGVDWQRKGGRIAAEAARLLNERGIPTELRVVGVEPEFDGPVPDYVKPYGRISKASPEGMARFTKLLGEAHFLIVPTRAEAYGIVYLEASAFGVPSLAARTGGVASALHEGVNGCLFDFDDQGAGYANKIEQFFRDPAAYRELALRGFRDHMARSNWDVVSKQALDVLAMAAGAKAASGSPPAIV